MKLAFESKFLNKSINRFKRTVTTKFNFCSVKPEDKVYTNTSINKENNSLAPDSKINTNVPLPISEKLEIKIPQPSPISKLEPFKENFLSFSYKNNINYQYDLQDRASDFFRKSQIKLIHYLDDRNINDFKKGIEENDYELYEIYRDVPEFLFLGRSNVGKSSLINSIFDRELTTSHKSPGKTQKLEFYLLGTPKKATSRASIYTKFLKIDQKNLVRNINPKGIFLDAPGFGYVSGPVELRRKFKYLIYTYMNFAVRLKQIFYLINGEYGMTDIDRQELAFINKFNKEIQLVFTKVDTKNKNNLIQYVSEASHFSRNLKNVRNEILLTSTRTQYGVHNLRTHLYLDINEIYDEKRKTKSESRDENRLSDGINKEDKNNWKDEIKNVEINYDESEDEIIVKEEEIQKI